MMFYKIYYLEKEGNRLGVDQSEINNAETHV